MVVKLKDIYKLANHMGDFLRKLDSDSEFAIIRDTLNLALLNLQRFHKLLNYQLENFSSTKFVIVDKYSWKWVELPNKKYPSNLPVVLEAIKMQNIDKVKTSLKEDISNKCDLIDRNVLHYGVHYFNKNIFQHLIELETNINKANSSLDIVLIIINKTHGITSTQLPDGQNALHLACRENNLFALRAMLARGANIYSSDEFGRTGMHWAVTTSDVSCLKCLLENGCDPLKCSDYEGMTPIMWAANLDKLDHLKLLLNITNHNSKNKPGVANNDKDEGDDDDCEGKDQYGRMWIHWCVHGNGDHSCLKEFLNKAVLKIKDNLGRSIVHIAAEKGSVEVMMMICSVGGDDVIEERDDLDRTPLIIASMGGQGELINHLLNMGADILKVDRFGASAWDYARSNQLHYCMLIIASYLRQSTNQIPFDASASINFNQSLRLSLTRSRSLELQQGAHSKQQTVENLKSSESRDQEGPLRPHPPESQNVSPPRNFRRHKTLPQHKDQLANDLDTNFALRHDDGELNISSMPRRKSGRKEDRTKRTTRRRMLRRDVTVATDSSDESRSTESNSHRKSIRKKDDEEDATTGTNHLEQSTEGWKKMKNFQGRPQDLPVISKNSQDKKAFIISIDEKSRQPKKVNFHLDEWKNNDISNFVDMEKFSKWDVNFCDQQNREQSPNTSNPWQKTRDKQTRDGDFNIPTGPRHRPLTPIGENSLHHLGRKSENKLPRKLEKISIGSKNDVVSMKQPVPAPRRSSFELKSGLHETN